MSTLPCFHGNVLWRICRGESEGVRGAPPMQMELDFALRTRDNVKPKLVGVLVSHLRVFLVVRPQ